MFRRKIEERINTYFSGKRERVLIVSGARQVGKTYIIRKLGKKRFKNFVEINLKDDFDGPRLFERATTVEMFYIQLSALYGAKLGTKDNTAIFLDEIQVYPHLITMLKPLRTDDRFTYIASGSLLGVTLRQTFIPMGSIEEARMFPMDFEEFLWATNTGSEAIDYLRKCFESLAPINDATHAFFLARFKEYLLCGGLPDAVKAFVVDKNIHAMRQIHSDICNFYKGDCAKYDQEHALKTTRIYELMSSCMENKVKRIRAKAIDGVSQSRIGKYADEFDYLLSSGVALSAKAVSDPRFPLNESSAKNLIKLYYNDVGLLTYLLYRNNVNAVLDNDVAINLGSVYETVAAVELTAHGHSTFYFDSKKVGEVDFMINDYDALTITPIEIKSGNDQNNFRAIPKLVDPTGKYKLGNGYIFGNKNIVKKENGLVTLPIYLIMFM